MIRIVVFGWLFITVILAGCSKKTGPAQTENTDPVNYETLWEKIDSLDGQQLYRSAQELAIEISQAATQEGARQQWIKAQIYLTKYAYLLSEDDLADAIEQIEDALELAEGAEAAVLHSLAGELYHTYFRTNSSKLTGRSETGDSDSTDIRTWSAHDLILKASNYYFESVADSESLKAPVSEYRLLLTEGNTDALRPTLYDVLAHRAFDYFSQNLWTLTSFYPDEEFQNKDFLAPFDEFVNIEIDIPAPHYYKHRALVILQDLIEFHLEDDPEALVHADLVRLNFVSQYLNAESSRSLYKEALERVHDFAGGSSAQAEVSFYLAQWYMQVGQDEEENASSSWVIADSICDAALSQYPDSYGASRCHGLKNRLHEQRLTIQTERVWLPDEYLLVHVGYRNIKKVYVKTFPLDQEDLMTLVQGGDNRDYWNEIFGRQPGFEEEYQLTGTEDLREHSTELILPPHKLGPHAIALFDDPDMDSARLIATITDVSRIGIYDESLSNIDLERSEYFTEGPDKPRYSRFIVLDRETGVPIEGALVEAYSYIYSPDVRRHLLTYMSRDKTDSNGVVENLNVRGARSLVPKVTVGEDVLFLNDAYRTYGELPEGRPRRRVSLFTDRAIYRPGQMLHFKGYAIQYGSDRLPSIIPGEDFKVELRDVNNTVVETIDVVSNEYGTFSGIFQLPESGLTGRMSLIVSNEGRHTVRVEEYKRPTFEVRLEVPEGSPAVGDTVNMNGVAQTFSGVPVTNAEVNYKVYKTILIPMYSWYSSDMSWRISSDISPRGGRGERKLIETGTAKTDGSGRFSVLFVADSVLNRNYMYEPSYVFEVVAEVTDQAGETQDARQSIRLNKHGFQFSLDGQQTVELDNINGLKVNAQSNNGLPITGTLDINIEQLSPPNKNFRERYWSQPDQWLYSSSEYQSMVPDYAYEGETGFRNYTVLSPLGTLSNEVTDGDSVALSELIEKAGVYKLSISFKSASGKTIDFDYYTVVNDSGNGEFGLKQVLHFDNDIRSGMPGDTINDVLHPEEDIVIRRRVNRWEQEDIQLYQLQTNKESNARIPISKSDRGGLYVSYTFVHNSRFYVYERMIQVPWDNKQLDVEIVSWRDNTMPGAEEEWEVSISGLEDQQSAEMLAVMYDMSLDAFIKHQWMKRGIATYPSFNHQFAGGGQAAFKSVGQRYQYYGQRQLPQVQVPSRVFSQLNWFGLNLETAVYLRGMTMRNEAVEMAAPAADMADAAPAVKSGAQEMEEEAEVLDQPTINIRENLDETVFFFPHQMSEQDGTLRFRFKMNEALTRWKFMSLYHTKDLKLGYCETEVTTSLPLMVTPHVPRFVRQDDDAEVTARIFNNTDSTISGTAELKLFNSGTDESITTQLISSSSRMEIDLAPGESTVRTWKIKVPGDLLDPIRYQVLASAGNVGDGEQGLIPVLTNRVFITDAQAIFIGSERTERIEIDALKVERQASFEPVQFSLEMSSNPAWYAVQALPYLNEYPHQCVEQQFNRYYANKIAAMIGDNSNIRKVLRQMAGDTDTQPLTGRDDLKSISIEDTPWLRAARSDEERLNDLIEFLDEESVRYNIDNDLSKLLQAQMSNGGFPWFPGGRDNWYITQYFVEGVGHLRKLGAFEAGLDPEVRAAIVSAITYMDARLVESYERILKAQEVDNSDDVEGNHYSSLIAHYFYARSFFNDLVTEGDNAAEATKFYLEQAREHWTNAPLYVQVLTASSFQRMNVYPEIVSIMQQSFEERSITDGDRGRFWKANTGWYWYEAPLERHAAMIEFFIDRNADQDFIDELRLYLLTNKRANQWSTTKSTSAAIYALVLGGDDWLSGDQVVVSSDETEINFSDAGEGTLYTRKDWEGEDVLKAPNVLTIANPNDHAAWGATYLQYFEDIDDVMPDEGNELRIRKELFVETFDGAGRKLVPVESSTELKKGDNLVTRLTIEADRDMEFIHIKDMRAAGFEPVNVLSNYKWKAGLGYYESTRDVATDFFIDNLRRGLYVFEYPLRVSHSGTYSSGIATIQSMYAPEYAAHSASLKLIINE